MEKLCTVFKLILRNMEELEETWRIMEGNRGIWRNIEEMDRKEHIQE